MRTSATSAKRETFNDKACWLFWLRARRVFLACAFFIFFFFFFFPPPIFITSICLFPPSCLVSFKIMHPAMVNQVTATFWQEQQLLSLRQVQSRLLWWNRHSGWCLCFLEANGMWATCCSTTRWFEWLLGHDTFTHLQSIRIYQYLSHVRIWKQNHQGNRFPLGHLVNLVSVTARVRPLRWPRTCSKAPGWWFTQNASEHTIASTFLATEFGLCKQDRGAQENNSASRAYLYSLILVKFLSFRCAMVCPSSSMNDSGDAARFARWKAV